MTGSSATFFPDVVGVTFRLIELEELRFTPLSPIKAFKSNFGILGFVWTSISCHCSIPIKIVSICETLLQTALCSSMLTVFLFPQYNVGLDNQLAARNRPLCSGVPNASVSISLFPIGLIKPKLCFVARSSCNHIFIR